MSTSAVSGTVKIKQEIKQDIDDQDLNVGNCTDIQSEIESEEHQLFFPKAEPTVSNCNIKCEHEQDSDVEIDPLALDPWEDADNSKQPGYSEKQMKSEDESISDKNTLLQSYSPMKQKLHECTVCGKTFSKPSQLVKHVRVHTGEKPFECTVCLKKFSQSANLTAHLRTHTGEKPHECTICKKKFSQSSQLVQHLRVHTREKPYECTVCKKKFSDSSNLATHLRIHTGEKPYECSVCNKKYSQPTHLRTHVRIHTGERPYECNICKKKFSRSTYLVRHSHTHNKVTTT